jgi:hypothetical protein
MTQGPLAPGNVEFRPDIACSDKLLWQVGNTSKFRRIVMVETVARWGHNTLLVAFALMFYAIAVSFR